jgi:DNA polymerase-3 subunit alpha
MKVLVKEGWVNQDTGKRSKPRIQFMLGAIFTRCVELFCKD